MVHVAMSILMGLMMLVFVNGLVVIIMIMIMMVMIVIHYDSNDSGDDG